MSSQGRISLRGNVLQRQIIALRVENIELLNIGYVSLMRYRWQGHP